MPSNTTVLGKSTLVVDFDAAPVVKGMDTIVDSFDTLQDRMRRSGGATTENIGQKWQGLGRGISAAWAGMGAMAVTQVGQHMQMIGGIMEGAGNRILGFFEGLGHRIFAIGGAFQSIRASFDGLFGEQSQENFARMQDIASRTLLSTQDVAQQTIFLSRAGIDALNVTGQTAQGVLPALEILSDLASSQGAFGRTSLRPAISNFLSGNVRSMQMRFDLTGDVTQQLKDIISETDDTQERFQRMIDVIGPVFGGAGAIMADTIGFQLEQINDNLENFFGTAAIGALEALSPLIAMITEWAEGLREAENETGAFGVVLTDVAEVLVTVVTPLVEIGQAIAAFALANPFILKWVSLFSIFGGVALVVLGSLIAAVGTFLAGLLGVVATVSAILLLLGSLELIAVSLLLMFSPLIALGVTLWGAWRLNLFGVQDLVERLTVGFTALQEIFSTMNEDGVGRLTEDTNDSLQRLGIRDFIVDLASGLQRLRVFATAAWTALSTAAGAAWEVLQPIMESLWGNLFGPGSAKGATEDKTSGAGATMSFLDQINAISPEQWTAFGQSVGKTIGQMLFGIDRLIFAIEFLMEVFYYLRLAGKIVMGVLTVIFFPLIGMFTFLGWVVDGLVISINAISRALTGSDLLPAIAQQLGVALGPSGVAGVADKQIAQNRTQGRGFAALAPTAADIAAGGGSGLTVQERLDLAQAARGGPKAATTEGGEKEIKVTLEIEGRQLVEALAVSEGRERQRTGLGE